MINQRANDEDSGAPLVVCINDCALDNGQPSSELAPICFKLGCAFAEMRWKSPYEKDDGMPAVIRQQTCQIYSTRLQ